MMKVHYFTVRDRQVGHISIKDFSEKSGIKITKLRSLLKHGKIPFVKKGEMNQGRIYLPYHWLTKIF